MSEKLFELLEKSSQSLPTALAIILAAILLSYQLANTRMEISNSRLEITREMASMALEMSGMNTKMMVIITEGGHRDYRIKKVEDWIDNN